MQNPEALISALLAALFLTIAVGAAFWRKNTDAANAFAYGTVIAYIGAIWYLVAA